MTTNRMGLTPEQAANTFTDAELEAMITGNNPQSNVYRELLAYREASKEPVAWWTGPEPTPTGEIESIHDHETGSHFIPLYAVPPLQAVTVPESMNPTTIRAVAAEYDRELDDDEANAAADGWNACLDRMLKRNHFVDANNMVKSEGERCFEGFWSGFRHPFAEDDELKQFAFEVWEASHAAILNHSEHPLDMGEPVSQPYKLRECLSVIRSAGMAIDAEKIQSERDSLNHHDCWCLTCRPVTITDMRFVVCPECGNKRCPRANDHSNACSGSNEPGQEGGAYPAAPKHGDKQ